MGSHVCGGEMCGTGKHTCGSGCGWSEDHPGALWPGYNIPPCKAVTDLGAHFSSYQVPHSPQEAALLGQDLRFLSLRPLETHSSGEHRTQTQEIKSHLAPERGQNPWGETEGSKFHNSHSLEREEARPSHTPDSQFEFLKSTL